MKMQILLPSIFDALDFKRNQFFQQQYKNFLVAVDKKDWQAINYFLQYFGEEVSRKTTDRVLKIIQD